MVKTSLYHLEIKLHKEIVRPQRHFQSILYTGNNASGRKITGQEFKPDFDWLITEPQSQNHTLYDTVRWCWKKINWFRI